MVVGLRYRVVCVDGVHLLLIYFLVFQSYEVLKVLNNILYLILSMLLETFCENFHFNRIVPCAMSLVLHT